MSLYALLVWSILSGIFSIECLKIARGLSSSGAWCNRKVNAVVCRQSYRQHVKHLILASGLMAFVNWTWQTPHWATSVGKTAILSSLSLTCDIFVWNHDLIHQSCVYLFNKHIWKMISYSQYSIYLFFLLIVTVFTYVNSCKKISYYIIHIASFIILSLRFTYWWKIDNK